MVSNEPKKSICIASLYHELLPSSISTPKCCIPSERVFVSFVLSLVSAVAGTSYEAPGDCERWTDRCDEAV